MSQQEMDPMYFQRDRTYPPYTSYQEDYYNEHAYLYKGQKIPLERTSLVPPLSQRLLLGLVSAVIWVLLMCFGLFIGQINSMFFLFLMVVAFTVCIIIINIIFYRVGLLLTANRSK